MTAREWGKFRDTWTHQHGVTNVWEHPPLSGPERARGKGERSAPRVYNPTKGAAPHLNQKPLEFMRGACPGRAVGAPAHAQVGEVGGDVAVAGEHVAPRRDVDGHAGARRPLFVGTEVLRGERARVREPERGRLLDVGASELSVVEPHAFKKTTTVPRVSSGPWHRTLPHDFIFSSTSVLFWRWTSSMTILSPSSRTTQASPESSRRDATLGSRRR